MIHLHNHIIPKEAAMSVTTLYVFNQKSNTSWIFSQQLPCDYTS